MRIAAKTLNKLQSNLKTTRELNELLRKDLSRHYNKATKLQSELSTANHQLMVGDYEISVLKQKLDAALWALSNANVTIRQNELSARFRINQEQATPEMLKEDPNHKFRHVNGRWEDATKNPTNTSG